MSSSVICQGLQSCLEPSIVDTRVLKLKSALLKSTLFSNSLDSASGLANSSSPVQPNDEASKTNTTPRMGGWSFLQSIVQPKDSSLETQKVYVHPLAKRSASALSKQSLEMCTESLGSETGSAQNSDEDHISSLYSEDIGGRDKPSRTQPYLGTRRMRRSVSFPPPLTSMSCSDGVQMRPYREGGRLILQAVPAPSATCYFHAERSEGRLRLLMVKPMGPSRSEAEPEESLEEVAQEEEEGGGGGIVVLEEEEEEEEEELEEEEENVEYGMEKLRSRGRPSRCNEVGLPQLDWEPFWVAT